MSNLTRAVEEENFICLCSLRTDYYDKFPSYRDFNRLLRKNNYTLPKIETNSESQEGANTKHLIKQIITEPAALCNVTIEKELVNNILEDLKKVNGPLPILQLCMQKLWKTKTGSKILLTDYSKISQNKSIAGIIEHHANYAFNRYTNNGRDTEKISLFKKIFIPHLIVVNKSGEDLRRTAQKKEINPDDDKAINEMLNNLISEEGRLLVSYKTKGKHYVDVVHEAIIREWSLLKEWINERRGALIYKERIEADAEKWKKDKKFIYKGEALKEACQWQKQNQDLESVLIQKFIQYSKTKNKNRKRNYALTTCFMIIFLGWSFIFQQQISQKTSLLSDLQAIHPEIKNLEIEKLEINHDALYRHLENDNIKKYLKKLTRLEITDNLLSKKVKDGFVITSLELFIGYDNIEELTLIGLDSLHSLAGIENLKNLKILKLESLNNLSSLSSINKQNSLTTLDIYNVQNLRSLSGIENLSNLRTLKLSELHNLNSLKGIEKLDNLTKLSIDYLFNVTSFLLLEELVNLQCLELLSLTNHSSLSGLENLTQLKSLTVGKSIFGDFSFEEFNKLKYINRLDTLKLYGLRYKEDFEFFKNYHENVELYDECYHCYPEEE